MTMTMLQVKKRRFDTKQKATLLRGELVLGADRGLDKFVNLVITWSGSRK